MDTRPRFRWMAVVDDTGARDGMCLVRRERPERTWKCSWCQRVNHPSAHFCANCGRAAEDD